MAYEYALTKGTILQHSSMLGKRCVYTIEKVLGQGGFGITYLATRKIGNIPQKFAIKEFFVKGQCWREAGNSRMMLPEAVEAKRDVKEWLHEFENEADLLNKICKETPNIVQVNEVFRANDTAYYVMEYLEGGSLRDIVKDGALPEDIALSYILPVVKAVYMLHTMEQPLLHCDIKHDNIMLRKHINGVIEPVLIDFGESRHFNEDGNLTTTHTTAGCSRGFAPMEQYIGITTFSPQVDVYALAATLYYIVTGDEPPFADDVTEERIRRKLPVSLSESLKGAIVHGMQKDKDKRTCDTRSFYKEISGKDIGDMRPETIVSPELPIGYSLKNKGKQYEIVSVSCRESYYIRYRVTCVDEGKVSSHGQTRRVQFDIYELFDKKDSRRHADKSVISEGNINASRKLFLSLCKKITKGEINGEFRDDSNIGWVTFASNNTFYLVDTHYRKPLSWKKILTYTRVGIGSVLLCVGAISLYNSIKVKQFEMSRKLTEAVATNNAEVLQEFAVKYDSTRAYLPYALICFHNGDLETAERFANDSLKSIIEQTKVQSNAQEQYFDSLFNAAESQYKNSQYDAAKETIFQMEGEYRFRQEVQQLLSRVEVAITNDLSEARFDSLYNVAQSQYDSMQFKTAKKTLDKMDNEQLSRQKVKDLLKAIEEAITPTDDEIFQQALRKKDWSTIERLANKGYSKAYYQLAQWYFDKKNYTIAKKWANKAINTGINIADSKKIVNSIFEEESLEIGSKQYQEWVISGDSLIRERAIQSLRKANQNNQMVINMLKELYKERKRDNIILH